MTSERINKLSLSSSSSSLKTFIMNQLLLFCLAGTQLILCNPSVCVCVCVCVLTRLHKLQLLLVHRVVILHGDTSTQPRQFPQTPPHISLKKINPIITPKNPEISHPKNSPGTSPIKHPQKFPSNARRASEPMDSLKTAAQYLIYWRQHSKPTIDRDTQITIKQTRTNAGLSPSPPAFSSVPTGTRGRGQYNAAVSHIITQPRHLTLQSRVHDTATCMTAHRPTTSTVIYSCVGTTD